MKDRPILFSDPMVRAILAGTKTQTRRVAPVSSLEIRSIGAESIAWVANFCPPARSRVSGSMAISTHSGGRFTPDQAASIIASDFCPHGQPGDRLWVRETFFAWGRWETRFSAKKGRDEWHFIDLTLEAGKSYLYAANGQQPQPMGGKRHKGGVTPTWWKRPAIFMPRAASRITLEITGVRVERLQDISEADAIAEGVNAAPGCMQDDDAAAFHRIGAIRGDSFPIARYAALWESINGHGSWDANPFVWVIDFKPARSG